PLGVLVAVDAQLGVVGEVRAELQEEGAKVLIEAVEVEVVDHGRGLDDPGVLLTGARVGALLGAENGGLLLGLADEEDAFVAWELEPILQGHVLLALSFGESEQGNLLLVDEVLDGGDEVLADGVHEDGGSKGVAAVKAEEGGDPGLM